jgi:hypothetical protein
VKRFTPSMFDAEFAFAYTNSGEMYWNQGTSPLHFINSSSYVLNEVRFNRAAQTSVPPGARVFLRQHSVEMLWDTFWSAAGYSVELSLGGHTCVCQIYISETGETSTRMTRHVEPDCVPRRD